MLKFFTFLILFLVARITNADAQDFNNSSFQKYIYKHPLNYINQYSSINDYDREFREPRNDYEYSSNYSAPKILNKNINFNDGKGVGYRVYDNSNRQSYFCDISLKSKKTFTHDNNFNGVYFGVGMAKIDATVNFSQTSKYYQALSISKPNPDPYKFSYSGSQILPSIIIGQGRLFSSGLFLGQEYAINIGGFEVSSNKIDNDEYSKISYSFSNYSYYSGKFGFNIFKAFLPYVKLSLSMSSSGFTLHGKSKAKGIFGGEYPNFGYGAGIDISIQDHIRAIIDYTQFSSGGASSESGANGYSKSKTDITNTVKFNSEYAFTRVSLVYKF